MGGDAHVSNVNLPNTGQMPQLPEGTIVETNARFDSQGVTVTGGGTLPEALAVHICEHSSRQSALVRAVLDGESAALFGLLADDPLLAHLPESQAREMFNRMVAATAHVLPDNLKGAA